MRNFKGKVPSSEERKAEKCDGCGSTCDAFVYLNASQTYHGRPFSMKMKNPSGTLQFCHGQALGPHSLPQLQEPSDGSAQESLGIHRESLGFHMESLWNP